MRLLWVPNRQINVANQCGKINVANQCGKSMWRINVANQCGESMWLLQNEITMKSIKTQNRKANDAVGLFTSQL